MLQRKNRKGQNTAEYAILIALVIGGVVAMQTYVQRAMQGRMRDASQSYVTTTGGNTSQYEPYYKASRSDTDKSDVKDETGSGISAQTDTAKDQATYFENTTYNGVAGW